MFTCPVCGWPELKEDPAPQLSYEICPSCGTEFGYECEEDYPEIRKEWLAKGKWWFSEYTNPPDNWNPLEQLRAAGLEEPK